MVEIYRFQTAFQCANIISAISNSYLTLYYLITLLGFLFQYFVLFSSASTFLVILGIYSRNPYRIGKFFLRDGRGEFR